MTIVDLEGLIEFAIRLSLVFHMSGKYPCVNASSRLSPAAMPSHLAVSPIRSRPRKLASSAKYWLLETLKASRMGTPVAHISQLPPASQIGFDPLKAV